MQILVPGAEGGVYLRASLGYIERPCLKYTVLTQNSNVKIRLHLYINFESACTFRQNIFLTEIVFYRYIICERTYTLVGLNL